MSPKTNGSINTASICHMCATSLLNAIDKLPLKSDAIWAWNKSVHRPGHPNQEQLISVRCFLCMKLEKMIQQTTQTRDWNTNLATCALDFWLYRPVDAYPNSYDVSVMLNLKDEAGTMVEQNLADILFQLDRQDQADELRAASFASTLQMSTSSEECSRVIELWMNECLTTHNCSRNNEPAWVPTRLLRLEPDQACLVTTAEHPINTSYATMSHCWGGDLPLKLTSENYARLSQGLRYKDFRPSFRDAMLTVRRLGIHFIWIDCLCIIQGSDEVSLRDWEVQSVQMGNVYAYGILNIGATAASSADDGCFVRRNIDGSEWGFFTDSKSRLMYRISEKSYFDELEEEPLLDRGWVIQERHLSSRMLHFGAHQLFWQCAEVSLASELSPRGLDTAGAVQDYSEYLLPPGCITNTRRPLSTSLQRFAWNGILQAYCNAKLTFPNKDKLRAIQGLAEWLSLRVRDMYSNGFFSRMLPKSLCWNTHSARLGRYNYNRRAVNRFLPSWHWASMDGSLSFDNECDEVVYTLIVMINMTDKVFVCIGRLVPISIQHVEYLPVHRATSNVPGDYFQELYAGEASWNRLFFFDDADEIDSIRASEAQLYILLVCTNLFVNTKEERQYSTNQRVERTSFLVLTARVDGTYRRIGAKRTLDDYANRNMKGSWLHSYRQLKPSLIVLS